MGCYVAKMWRWHVAHSMGDTCQVPIGKNVMWKAWITMTRGTQKVGPHHLRWHQQTMSVQRSGTSELRASEDLSPEHFKTPECRTGESPEPSLFRALLLQCSGTSCFRELLSITQKISRMLNFRTGLSHPRWCQHTTSLRCSETSKFQASEDFTLAHFKTLEHRIYEHMLSGASKL